LRKAVGEADEHMSGLLDQMFQVKYDERIVLDAIDTKWRSGLCIV
jgi:hypothetical protein